MCDRDSVQTYDPRFTEEHTDSSDFESDDLPKLKKNKLLLNKKLLRKVKLKEKDLDTNYVNYGDYKNEYRKKKTQVSDRYKDMNRDSDSSVKITKTLRKKYRESESRSEIVLRDKVITRFSNIFRHANSNDKQKVVEENRVRNDHACQVYSKDYKTKKRRKNRCNLDPIHKLKRQTDTPYKTTKVVNYSAQQVLRNVSKRNSKYGALPTTSSFSSELDVVTLDSKDHQENSELRDQYAKLVYGHQQDKQTKTSHISSKKQDYQVFSEMNSHNKGVGSYCYKKKSPPDISQARSSIFWEYMINKIQQKGQRQRLACAKPCHCCEMTCDAKKNGPVSCPFQGGCCSSSFNDTPPSTKVPHTPQEQYDPIPTMLCKKTSNKKIQCKCPSDRSRDMRSTFDDPWSDDIPVSDRKPCQQDHDLVTKTLADKYNGEILCIHNPPCILINGCFNVGAKEAAAPTWFVTQDKNICFSQTDKPVNDKKDKTHAKYIDILQYYREEERIEKEMQSACHHSPPCKLVRQCCKPKYSPKLDYCCVHVPMCRKVPECQIECEDVTYGLSSCKHKPKCRELPLCARDWLLYGEISNVQSEVKKSSDLICPHNPPCIKIPKCLGRLMRDGFVPFDAIPDCSHQPPCEKIPACFRKPPKMISTYSQYPAPCRIV